MISDLFSRKAALLVATAIFGLAIACGSATVAEPAAAGDVATGSASDSTVSAHNDGDDHEAGQATALAEHEDDEDHTVLTEEEHSAGATEAGAHGDGQAVDPDAPVSHVFATEFGYESTDLKVEAGTPFTFMLHNEGVLEHDITIEGLEELGGIHLLSGEDGMATFEVSEPGEYTVYCTVPGHRDAGMESILVVEAAGQGA